MKFSIISLILIILFVSGCISCPSNTDDLAFQSFPNITIERAINIVPFEFKIATIQPFIDSSYAEVTIIKDDAGKSFYELGISFVDKNKNLILSFIVSEHVHLFRARGKKVYLQEGTRAFFKEDKDFGILNLSWKEGNLRYSLIFFKNDHIELTLNQLIQIANSRIAVNDLPVETGETFRNRGEVLSFKN